MSLLRFFAFAMLLNGMAAHTSEEHEDLETLFTIDDGYENSDVVADETGTYSVGLKILDKILCVKVNQRQLAKIFGLIGATSFFGASIFAIATTDYLASYAANKAPVITIEVFIPFVFSGPWFLAAFVMWLRDSETEDQCMDA